MGLVHIFLRKGIARYHRERLSIYFERLMTSERHLGQNKGSVLERAWYTRVSVFIILTLFTDIKPQRYSFWKYSAWLGLQIILAMSLVWACLQCFSTCVFSFSWKPMLWTLLFAPFSELWKENEWEMLDEHVKTSLADH